MILLHWLQFVFRTFVRNFIVMDANQQKLLQRITISPGVLSGKPAIRGLRFLVSDVLELLSSGMTEADILEQHLILEKEDIQAALLYA